MISIETEAQLLRTIMTIARGEKTVEDSRLILAQEKGFEPSTAFQKIDTSKTGKLSESDLKLFLQKNGYDVSIEKIRRVIAFYNDDKDDSLCYKGFLSIILSTSKPGLRSSVILRESTLTDKAEKFGSRLEHLLANLLSQEIELLANLAEQRRKLYERKDFDLSSAFRAICKTEAINYFNLGNYLKKKGAGAQREDVAAFIRRADRDLDTVVGIKDFAEALLPSEEIQYVLVYEFNKGGIEVDI